jgi:protein-tyrosine phosphatase
MSTVEYKKVLFICTGNRYRSRLAEVLFNHHAAQRNSVWESDSRGMAEKVRFTGMSPVAMSYLEAIGIEGPEQYARAPTAVRLEDLESFDLVIGMNRS